MSLTLITAPVGEPLTLAEIKFFLRVAHDTDDSLITDLAEAARGQVEAVTGLALMTQGWRLTLDRWPTEPVTLLRPPVQSVTSVSVQGTDGIWTELDEGDYALIPGYPARVLLKAPPPSPGIAAGGIRIDFTAGFGDADAVPGTLKQAMRLLTAHYHEHRTPASERRVTTLPNSVGALLAPWREVRL
ncbi:head-tail connector protein [Aquisalinus flavus]|uniref:PhiE125 gp8 family phage protein n=1 Tax=Aquisalinus flavus TaxID=1526572 RepID=A0A8J2Y3S6_9PROT|nr:phage head-tail connector protein [Aquisalinus flavus]MBD0426285.1 phage head-tail connector protein [Aquisalinus flavus]UNE48146.1 hypothetical protein FF099_08830 [Aquisalinus flavus]GGD09169.1 hypothetical protein GCM10011342_17510 [Aquisalinus flavus]